MLIEQIFAISMTTIFGLSLLVASLFITVSQLAEYQAHEFLICVHTGPSKDECSQKFDSVVNLFDPLISTDWEYDFPNKETGSIEYTTKTNFPLLNSILNKSSKQMQMIKPRISHPSSLKSPYNGN